MVLLTCLFLWNVLSREQGEAAAFQNLWLSVSSHLQMDSVLSDSFLAQTEVASQAVIHIEENSSPLLYPGSWAPPPAGTGLSSWASRGRPPRMWSPPAPPVSSSIEQSSVFRIKGDAWRLLLWADVRDGAGQGEGQGL